MDFFDADRLAGKDLAEINFLATETDAPTSGDHDSFIVEGIVDVRQAGVGARGRLAELLALPNQFREHRPHPPFHNSDWGGGLSLFSGNRVTP